ncbi:MAG TPA: ribonuclease H [Opitutae bacterium]|mgnify:FL=1|nr:ribonuclease H [Opitutae bacterium]
MGSTRLRMKERTLYIDASVDTKSKTGFGAHLLIDRSASTTEYQNGIEVKQFDFTSSTKLELQNLLWAFSQIGVSGGSLVVYTDSQNLIQLPVRRSALEQKKFKSKKGLLLRNHELYRQFFKGMDRFDCRLVKVKGHKRNSEKDTNDKIFTFVDRAARKALRSHLSMWTKPLRMKGHRCLPSP